MDLFSFNMTNVMIGLIVAVALILLYLVLMATRNPVLIKIGLRNIPRRPAQSILIVLGLTLSTIIIVSSLTTGDTLTYSVRYYAVQSYGRIDEIVAPPLLSLLASLGEGTDFDEAAAENEQVAELSRLTEGGLTSLLAVLEGGLPGISTDRLAQLKQEAADEPLIDAVSGSIIFPTIIRNTTTGQGEPFGFIFAVDNDYDQLYGLSSIEGQPVEMETLQTGVGNVFAQAANLFGLIEDAGARLGLGDVRISDVAMATAAVAAALTTGTADDSGLDLAEVSIDLETLRGLGIDTSLLEQQGIESISLESLGLTQERLDAIGVTTTTVSLDTVGVDTSGMQTVTNQLMGALNLNTLGSELDQVLAQAGLQLRQGDVYLSRLGAERLNARVGDVLEVYIGPLPLPFRVKGIVDQAGPMSAIAPVVMLRLDEAQKLLFMNGRVNNILISNTGDEVEGLAHTQAVSDRLRVLALEPSAVATVGEILRRPDVKPIVLDELDEFAQSVEEDFDGPPFMRDFFMTMTGFGNSREIADQLAAELDRPETTPALRELLANINLRSFLSELPLPAEDRAELRAVLSELNQFDVLDPLSKATVVSAAEIGGVVFTTVFSVFGILSIIAGVLLIFLIFVMLAAERRSEMGVARAIGVQRNHVVQMFVTEGVVYDLLAAALGVGLGLLISFALVGVIGNLFNTATEQLAGQSVLFRIRFSAAPTSIIVAYCLGVLFTFIVVTAAAWRVSRLNIVAAIRDLEEPPGRGRTTGWGRTLRLLFGPLLIVAGGVLIYYTREGGFGFLQASASLIVAGIAFLIGWIMEQGDRRQEIVQRIVYTLIGLGLVLIWALPWSSWLVVDATPFDEASVFVLGLVLGGPLMIIGAILVVMFNADAWTWGINRLLGGIGWLTPVLKTAIAYPLSARFRTGMAMLLFAMIISVVTLMTVVIDATQTLVAPDSERNAGFDISVSGTLFSFFDPLEDLAAEIPDKPDFPAEDVALVGSVATSNVRGRQQLPEAGKDAVDRRIDLVGLNDDLIQQMATVYSFRLRGEGFADDAAVWEALRTRDDVAVITPDLLRQGEAGSRDFGPPEHDMDEEDLPPGMDPEEWLARLIVAGVDEGATSLPETVVTLRSEEGDERTVQVIGVIAEATTLPDEGFWVNKTVLDAVMGEEVVPDNFYIKVAAGADVHQVAQAVERAFLNNAVNATLMAESFAQAQALTRGILQVFQGFLALGLLVGIAALGVISTRTVVERRQQVGMLRAIGFQPRMVALSFLLESSFIALTGIFVGTATGVLLGRALVTSSYESIAEGRAFAVPWVAIIAIVVGAYLFSLLTTILPALQASRIYPAEALRYE